MSVTDTAIKVPEALASRVDQLFPVLNQAQIERIAARGRARQITQGEVLVEAGDHDVPFFLITAGKVEIVQSSGDAEVLITAHGPGQFTGEVNMLSGRPALARMRVAESGEVIQMDRESMLSLVQTDTELGEIIMRAYILRRVGLIANRVGDVVVIGSQHCGQTLRVKEFLSRNGHPYSYIDLD